MQPKYKVGDLVMFSRACQRTEAGMRVQEVDHAPLIGDTRYKVDDLWWHEGCFMPFETWKKLHRRKS